MRQATKAILKSWKTIAREPAGKTLKFHKKIKLDKFNSAEEVHTHHQEAYEKAATALKLLEEASLQTKSPPGSTSP